MRLEFHACPARLCRCGLAAVGAGLALSVRVSQVLDWPLPPSVTSIPPSVAPVMPPFSADFAPVFVWAAVLI